VLRDPDYARQCARRPIDCLDRIEGLRGTHRYFLSYSPPNLGRSTDRSRARARSVRARTGIGP
jgi:hypothetical protein